MDKEHRDTGLGLEVTARRRRTSWTDPARTVRDARKSILEGIRKRLRRNSTMARANESNLVHLMPMAWDPLEALILQCCLALRWLTTPLSGCAVLSANKDLRSMPAPSTPMCTGILTNPLDVSLESEEH